MQTAHDTTDSAPERKAADFLRATAYEELHAVARRYFKRQPAAHTLCATALVHEAYLRLAAARTGAFREREHFMAVAATAMRQILVDRARRRAARKRGGGDRGLTLHEHAVGAPASGIEVDVLALDRALAKLASLDERKARIVELRFFAGASIPETAAALDIARSTVTEDWRLTRAWLALELGEGTRG